MSPDRRRQLARVAAPAAFLLFATIAVLIVRSALHDDEQTGAARSVTTVGSRPGGPTTRRPPARRPRARRPATPPAERTSVYVIESGDTLGTIADEHDTTVERLLELNPNVDAFSLRVGQRIRVPAG